MGMTGSYWRIGGCSGECTVDGWHFQEIDNFAGNFILTLVPTVLCVRVDDATSGKTKSSLLDLLLLYSGHLEICAVAAVISIWDWNVDFFHYVFFQTGHFCSSLFELMHKEWSVSSKQREIKSQLGVTSAAGILLWTPPYHRAECSLNCLNAGKLLSQTEHWNKQISMTLEIFTKQSLQGPRRLIP